MCNSVKESSLYFNGYKVSTIFNENKRTPNIALCIWNAYPITECSSSLQPFTYINKWIIT